MRTILSEVKRVKGTFFSDDSRKIIRSWGSFTLPCSLSFFSILVLATRPAQFSATRVSPTACGVCLSGPDREDWPLTSGPRGPSAPCTGRLWLGPV